MTQGYRWTPVFRPICWAMLVVGVFSLSTRAATPDITKVYAKKGSWAETMLATRANVGTWLAEQERTLGELEMGPWHKTSPLKCKSFKHVCAPELGIDLSAKGKGGKPLWTKRGNLRDGVVHRFKQKSNKAATYLYRTMTAPKPITLTAYLGSDDGIAVWLNGKKVHVKDVPRGVAPDQDKVQLRLKAGQNELLLKIYNRTGDHGFYFNLRSGLTNGLWRQIARDFPTEARWMQTDTAGGGHLAWFRSPKKTRLEVGMIKKALGALGKAGQGLASELESLSKAGVPADNPKWLNLYVRACTLRDGLAKVQQVDLAPLRRAVVDLTESFPDRYKEGPEFARRLSKLQSRLDAVKKDLNAAEPEAVKELPPLLAALDTLRDEALLANPLIDFDKLLLVNRKANRLGLPQNWQGNCAIPRAGYDNEIATFSPISPKGTLKTLYRPGHGEFVGDVELHFDADKMLFSMPDRHGRWQIWEIRADGSGLRQVTPGEHRDVDNYDACYLPNGRIIFASTRCFQGIPCVGGGNTVANLCIMDADGKAIRQLCFDQDHNWCPTVLNNGRVLYSRWEYSDTPHYFSRLLFHMNPDGTGQMEFYGSNSFWPNSMFYARPIPGDPSKVVTIVSGHHGVPRMGELVILDPAKGRREADGVVQRIPGYGKPVPPIIVDQLVNPVWPKFLHPFPLSDKYFLVSCKPTPSSEWGLYLVDVFDNILLLKELPGRALFEPVPLKKQETPPIVPDKVDLSRRDGVVYLSDIYYGRGLEGVPRGKVKKLRIFEFHYAYPKMGGHKHIAVEGTWDVHRIVGTVPVLEDGSAIFKVPANTPLAVQPLDEEGRALQVMRSWFVAMPGEVISCVGCHEHQGSSPPLRYSQASTRPPVEIEPWYGPTRGFSFKREVQPVLDQYCVGCHNGEKRPDGKAIPDFTRKDKNGWGNFTPSYLELHRFVRRPGPESDYHLQKPMEWHAGTSELIQMLEKGHHGVTLDAEAWDRLVTWIDLNVPDHGTWSEHRKIPHNYHQRRLEMRTRYANRPEDPEAIPESKRPPVTYTPPECPPKPPAEKVTYKGWPFDTATAKQRQQAAGKQTAKKLDLGGGVTMDLVLIPPGQFVMGSTDGCADEWPLTRIAITEPFWMGVTEVTLGQYHRFDPGHKNGFINQHHKDHTTPGYPVSTPEHPVIRVTWKQAMMFCKWLGAKTGLKVTLPTEAQWEWACRAGSNAPFWYGDADTNFSGKANLADAAMKLLAVTGVNPSPIKNPSKYEDWLPQDKRFNDKAKIVTTVAQYQENPWGLKDMHGNVAEWTRSLMRPYPYRADDGRNDLAAAGQRVVRGGSWRDRPHRSTASFRLGYERYQPVYNVGFRVVVLPGTATAMR